jgi:hypothetical protein
MLAAGPSVLSQVSAAVQIAFFATTGIVAVLSYVTAKRTIFQPLRAEVFKKQIEDLGLVLKLFSGKGEYQLQEDFAFSTLIEANIAKMYDAYVNFAFGYSRPEEVLEYRHELCPSSMVLPEGLTAMVGYRVDDDLPAKIPKPKEWEYPNYEISLPRAFSVKQKEFEAVIDSPLLPRPIAKMLQDYLSAVDDNASTVREVIQECSKDMPSNYPTLNDIKQSSFGWIHHAIIDKRMPLEPIAKSINEHARSYFDSDNLFSVNNTKRRKTKKRMRASTANHPSTDADSGVRRPSRFRSALLIGAEFLPWKIRVKVERPQRSEDVRP